ncbi:MAG: S-layer y domain protein [Firmicutes bacterium]|nr:S-layer y domain protein [Bacillota bacterium]
MKKWLGTILTLVLLLSITSTALAAEKSNPWVDLPKGNWAYNAIVKLAQDGIIENSHDADKILTRYEVAKIVARAIAHEDKANAEDRTLINKLSEEFSQELADLHAKISSLDKKVNKVNFGGVLILKYDHHSEGTTPNWVFKTFDPKKYTPNQVEGCKFVLSGDYRVSDIWTIQTMGEFTRDFEDVVAKGTGLTEGNHDETKGMWVSGNFPGFRMNLGRYPYKDAAYGFVLDEYISGVQILWGHPSPPGPGLGSGVGPSMTVNFGKLDEGVNLMNWRGIPSSYSFIASYAQDDLLFADSAPGIRSADIIYPLSQKTNLTADYIHLTSSDNSTSSKSFAVAGFDTKLSPDIGLKAVYSKSNYSTDNKGYMFSLTYKGAIPFVPRSWGVYVNWTKAEANSTISTVDYDIEDCVYGAKGITVGYEYIPRPGVIYTIRYIHMVGITSGYTDFKDNFIRVAAIIPIF